MLDEDEEGDVDGECDEREERGEEGRERREERERDVRGEREQERDERHARCCMRVCVRCSVCDVRSTVRYTRAWGTENVPTGWMASPRVQEGPTVTELSLLWA